MIEVDLLNKIANGSAWLKEELKYKDKDKDNHLYIGIRV